MHLKTTGLTDKVRPGSCPTNGHQPEIPGSRRLGRELYACDSLAVEMI